MISPHVVSLHSMISLHVVSMISLHVVSMWLA